MPMVATNAATILDDYIVGKNAKDLSELKKTSTKKPKKSVKAALPKTTVTKHKQNVKQKPKVVNNKKQNKPKSKEKQDISEAKPGETKKSKKQHHWPRLSQLFSYRWARKIHKQFYGPPLFTKTIQQIKIADFNRDKAFKEAQNQKFDKSCCHCSLYDLVPYSKRDFKYYSQNYFKERFCVECSCAIIETKSVNGIHCYGCNQDLLNWSLPDTTAERKYNMCCMILCTNCHMNRLDELKMSGRRKR